jgi:hypothetical protein
LLKSPDQNHNSLLTVGDQKDGSAALRLQAELREEEEGSAALRLEEELQVARQELMTTHTLMEEIRTLRAHSRQQGETKDSEAVRVTSNHNSSNVRTRNSSDDNRNSISGSLTTQQLDKLLDRYDGFVPQVV